MHKLLRFSMALAAAVFFAVFVFAALPRPAPAAEAIAGVKAVSCPAVMLEHWRNSSRDEKLSFLFGFASLLEMEKEWQGNQPLPIKQSIIGSWIRGLDGVTLGQMSDAIDAYAARHPDQMDLSVLEVLGGIYVRPKMTQAEIVEAEKRVREIKTEGVQ
jgi:hypothetical protein